MAYPSQAPAPAELHAPYGVPWPPVRMVPDAVVVRFRAGYGPTLADVPDTIKLAVMRRAWQLYENSVNDEDILAICGSFKVWSYR